MNRMVGRGLELDALRELLLDVIAGSFRVGLIEGEAGIGKSRLLAAAQGEAQDLGSAVLFGRADELESSRPFGPLVDALPTAPSKRELDRGDLGRTIRERGEGWEEHASELIVDGLEQRALKGPLMIALEDLQWSDQATIGALRRTTRRLSHLPIALVATMRPLPRSPTLARLIDILLGEGATHLRLQALGPAAVEELVTMALGAPPGPRLLAGVTGAGGNPLFVTELVKALEQEGAIRVAGGKADAATVTLPPTLRLTILRRLSSLPGPTLETLRAASILGSTFDIRELATLLGRPVVDISASLRPAQETGVVAERDERMAFRHDLIREAIEADLATPVRAVLQAETARMLERAGAPPERVAAHLVLSATPGDEAAISSLIRTAEAAGDANDRVTLLLYERGAELLPTTDPRRDAVVAAMLQALTTQGRGSEAAALARDILARPHDPALDYRLHRSLQFVLYREGRLKQVSASAAELLAQPWLTQEQRWLQESYRAIAQILSGDFNVAEAFVDRAVPGARERGQEQDLSLILCEAALVASGRGHVLEALSFADEAAGIRARLPRAETADAYRGLVLIDADRLEEAASSFQLARARLETEGDLNSLPLCYWGLAFIGYVAGRWDSALAEAEAGSSVFTETGEIGIGILYPYAIRGLIALHRGRIAEAEEHVAAGLAIVDDVGPQIGMDLLWLADGLLHEARGDNSRALHLVHRAWDAAASMRYFMSWRSTAPELVRLAVAEGDVELAARVCEEAAEGSRRAGKIPSARGTALRCSAIATGDLDTVLAAADAYARSARVREHARALEDAAVLLARAGRNADARRVFDEALAIYDELGAVRDASRAAAAMRSAGIRRGSRALRKRPVSGWEALTPTERDVAVLTVEGLTNQQIGDRLFVSKHTVRTHLSHAFTKLEITSRAELAAVAARRQAESSHPPADPRAGGSGSVARGQRGQLDA